MVPVFHERLVKPVKVTVDMVVNAYDPRPERGQDAAQTAADVDACRTKSSESLVSLSREPSRRCQRATGSRSMRNERSDMSDVLTSEDTPRYCGPSKVVRSDQ